jgi:BirA family biotin operon repressor/biotin-[acetyl-CoA-carboxylase] ligase
VTDADGLPSRVGLDRDLLRRAVADTDLWTTVDVVDSLGSSNVALAELARAGAPSGSVLVAEEQTAGRGRRDRGWSAPPYSSVMVSMLVRPEVDPARWGWIPLLTALAIVDAVRAVGVRATVKWPNDVLVGDRKLAGVLCEVVPTMQGGAVVVGWGVNVDQFDAELPDTATSLRLECGPVDRAALLLAVLDCWESWYRSWEADDGRLFPAYTRCSATIGRQVAVELPDGSRLRGSAARIDERGSLVVIADGREQVVAAADVVHLRPGAS